MCDEETACHAAFSLSPGGQLASAPLLLFFSLLTYTHPFSRVVSQCAVHYVLFFNSASLCFSVPTVVRFFLFSAKLL